jgi:hypothetical protein
MNIKLWTDFKKHFVRTSLPYRVLLKYQRIMHPTLFRRTDQYWRNVRGKYTGQAGFVVGNGPSLKLADLDSLRKSISIASNKIYLAFPDVAWRPTFFSCSDWLVWDKIQTEVPRHFHNPLLLSSFKSSTLPPDAVLMKNLGFFMTSRIGFSLNSAEGQYGGYTVTYNNLQTAVHLGLNPIYLIGCDHYYSGELTSSVGKPLVMHKGQQNHFIPNYRSPGEIVNMAPIGIMNEAYNRARTVCETKGIRILNATRGGHLDVFERINLDDVLSGL